VASLKARTMDQFPYSTPLWEAGWCLSELDWRPGFCLNGRSLITGIHPLQKPGRQLLAAYLLQRDERLCRKL
jgi:hypothetical protein